MGVLFSINCQTFYIYIIYNECATELSNEKNKFNHVPIYKTDSDTNPVCWSKVVDFIQHSTRELH